MWRTRGGAGLGLPKRQYVDRGDPTKIKTKSSFVYGADFGVDIPFGGSSWTFSGNLRYLVFDLETEMKDEFGYGANFGVDIPIGSGKWVITAGLQYLALDAKTDEGGDDITIGIDPIIAKVGAGVRF